MWRSLGKVTVTTPGILSRATKNEADPTARVACQTVMFQQWPGNTGKIYICDRSTAVASTGVGVIAILPIPSTSNFPATGGGIATAPDPLNATDFYIDAEVAGEGVLVSYMRA
jgi:hypothetical protein